MKFPKKQAQRLIPEYLLDYTTKLNESHPDPTQSWGGGSGGSEYTAGDGINISSGNVISVDNTIAKKSEIPSLDGYATQTWVQEQGYATSSEIPTNYVTTDTSQTITGLKTIGQTSGTISEVDFSGFTFKLSNKAINNPEADIKIRNASYDGYQYPTIYSTKGLYVNLAKIKLGEDGNNTYGITMPDSTTWETDRVLATIDDIPTKTSELDNDSGFITNVTWNDITNKPTFATVATSGSYNDLTDKPYIFPSSRIVDTDTKQDITGTKTFEGLIKVKDITNIEEIAILPYKFDYTVTDSSSVKSRARFNLPTSKPRGTVDAPTEYTFAMTDDIPTVNNPTITFTQGGTTKGTITLNQSGDQTIEFDAGGGGGGSTTNMVTTDTNQDITGEKTFVGTKRIKFKQSYSDDRLGFTGYDKGGTEIGYLEMNKTDRDFTGNPTSNILGYWSNVNSAPNPSADVMLGFKYYTKDSDGNTRDYKLVVPPRYNETRVTRYIPISVNGNTADNTGNINVPTETLVFTLADNSTVTINVMTSSTASTTNTV